MKIDLRDVTFMIPIRVDSMVRLENLVMCVDYLQKHFRTNIHILEAAAYRNDIIPSVIRGKDITYTYLEDKDPVFYKTRYLNIMSSQAMTPIVGIWDADILVDKKQIIEAVNQLRKKNCEVAYPYNGDFMDSSAILRAYYWQHRDIRFLNRHRSMMKALYSVKGKVEAVGGAIFVKTDKYIEAGGDSERFYGWGMEDGERHLRWVSFGYRIFRSRGCLYHLSHPRDMNGHFRSSQHRVKATNDTNYVLDLTLQELKEYIKNQNLVLRPSQ